MDFWVVVILAGMLNAAGGIEAGYSEMSDMNRYPFETREQCEKSRPAIEANAAALMAERLGAENILVTSACWRPERRS